MPACGKNFCRKKVSGLRCAKGSHRTLRRGNVRVLICCPRGRWKGGSCSVGTRAKEILYPIGSRKCPAACRRKRVK